MAQQFAGNSYAHGMEFFNEITFPISSEQFALFDPAAAPANGDHDDLRVLVTALAIGLLVGAAIVGRRLKR